MKARQIISIALIALLVFSLVYVGCTNNQEKPPKVDVKPAQPKTEVKAPEFIADTAFQFIEKQVSFGPRVPNSESHSKCGDWIVNKMKQYGASVTEQKTTLKAFDGTMLNVRNIIAAFFPENKSRILLCAHWDTRPFADKDPNKSNWNKPIDGANDGGSGVGVLMEIARQISLKAPSIGIDFIFFDAEDYGTPEFRDEKNNNILNDRFISSWCLGSQYFALNPHVKQYNPRYGILLDMVASSDARFNKERFSSESAPDVLNLVWNTAAKLGYEQYFLDEEVEAVTDDHVMLNRAGYRVIDIIDTRPQPMAMGLGGYVFGGYHHTHNDNMSLIDKNTLKAVGQTLLQVVYNQ